MKANEKKTEITVEAIVTALSKGATSLTGISKSLGYIGSVSGSTAKLIRKLVPDVDAMIDANRVAKDSPIKDDKSSVAKPKGIKAVKAGKITTAVPEKKPAVKKTASKAEYPIPELCPYRPSSGYAKIFAILHFHGGISKSDLTAKYKAWSGKPDQNCGFDVHVVISPREDGSCHRSAGKASQSYWVEREGDFLKLRLIGEDKK